MALAWVTIRKQLFSLLHCCQISDLQSVASEIQTNGSTVGQGQDYRVDGPEVPSETTAITLTSNLHCVGLHCRAEGSQLATDVQISSCEQPHAVIAVCCSRHSH
jgi:hypothetical protein